MGGLKRGALLARTGWRVGSGAAHIVGWMDKWRYTDWGGGRIPVTVVTLLSMWNIESGCFDVKM